MAESLKEKVVLVTGGASGIGRAAALAFAREMAKVVVADLDAEGAKETARLIKSRRGEATSMRCDVSESAEVDALVSETVKLYKRLDCAFNNAGILGEMSSTADCTEENFDRIIKVNLKGVWLCMKYEIPQMIKQGGGVIVNTSSNAGMKGVPGLPAYGASKSGIVQLSRTAALEYAKFGIRVTAVCPGFIFTPMVEKQRASYPEVVEKFAAQQLLGRLGKPEEIAEAVVWLCTEAASYVTGYPIVVDGGALA